MNESGPLRRIATVRSQQLPDLLHASWIGANKPDLQITGVQDDSRAVAPGDLFVAVVGLRSDGHDYAQAAVDLGAVALVVERELDIDIPQLLVDNASFSLGLLAATMAGRPADSLTNIGITGTNGKTTTAYLVEAILQAAGRVTGLLGTVSYRFAGTQVPAPYTTPTPLVLQDAFLAMQDHDCDTAILEVSSAALHMDRLVGTPFAVAGFSNLSQDHLDVHSTMEKYRDAKARLFTENLADDGTAVINIDDPAGPYMAKAAGPRRILRVSRNPQSEAEICVQRFSSTIAGIVATISTPRGILNIDCTALIGHYNVDNIALAVGIAEALQIPHDAIIAGIAQMAGVPGRVERVPNAAGLHLFVDYAHTPDALVNVLAALRPLTKGRLLCVFGCGGDRDPSKRPAMGAAVAEFADLAIITSDNPRTEDPQSIIDAISPSVPNAFFVDVNRRTAILAATLEATANDVVLIAGKGHEDYQIIGTEKIHFDDREEAKRACTARRPLISTEELLQVCDGTLLTGDQSTSFARVGINGREVAPGDLYVAIVGQVHDGHRFCQQAIDGGATGILVARGRGAGFSGVVIEVDDPRVALGQIARFHRQAWSGTVVGITGSAGKTTCKELVSAALRSRGPVHAAAGSNNNETGVPLTLLGLKPIHDFAVIEMGMRALGEIEYLAKIALPTVQLVINAGSAHLGELGSTDAIAQAKGELFGDHKGPSIAIFPCEDSRLAKYASSASSARCFSDSTQGEATRRSALALLDYRPMGRLGSELQIEVDEKRYPVTLPLVGKHNAINACAAILTAWQAGATLAGAIEGISKVRPPDMRGQVEVIAGRNILIDCYNANPASMTAALHTLAELRGESNGLAVLGDMLELGQDAADCHCAAGSLAAKLKLPIVALGEFRNHLVTGATSAGGLALEATSPKAAAKAILQSTLPGDWILLKASRGMKLEQVADAMRQESSTQ